MDYGDTLIRNKPPKKQRVDGVSPTIIYCQVEIIIEAQLVSSTSFSNIKRMLAVWRLYNKITYWQVGASEIDEAIKAIQAPYLPDIEIFY